MKGLQMIGKLIGATLGGAVNSQRNANPVPGAIIGAAAMTVARRVLPARFAVLGAAVATGYVTRKLAQRAERRQKLEKRAATAPAKTTPGRKGTATRRTAAPKAATKSAAPAE